jgi:hypothetical protein
MDRNSTKIKNLSKVYKMLRILQLKTIIKKPAQQTQLKNKLKTNLKALKTRKRQLIA